MQKCRTMNCDQRTALQGIRHYTDRVTRTGMHGIRDMHEIHAIQQTHANRKATAYRSVVDHIPSPQPAAPYLAVSVTLHHPYSVAALNQLRHLAHNHSSTTGGSSSRLSTVGHWSATNCWQTYCSVNAPRNSVSPSSPRTTFAGVRSKAAASSPTSWRYSLNAESSRYDGNGAVGFSTRYTRNAHFS